jgi:hypothetical protein
VSDPTGELPAIAARLRAIAARLRSDQVDDEEAEQLAREAADLVSSAGNELDRASQEPAQEG